VALQKTPDLTEHDVSIIVFYQQTMQEFNKNFNEIDAIGAKTREAMQLANDNTIFCSVGKEAVNIRVADKRNLLVFGISAFIIYSRTPALLIMCNVKV